MTDYLQPWEIRKSFSQQLSEMYRKALPLYVTLAEQTLITNKSFMQHHIDQDFDGRLKEVTEERHGAIRLGLPEEMRLMARFFRILDMYPVNYYDFTDLASPLPITASGFRPVTTEDMSKNPFRMFTSLLRLDDRRFFPEDIAERALAQLRTRTLFSEEAVTLIDKAEADGGLVEHDASQLVLSVIPTFQMNNTAIPKDLYDEIGEYADIARDIVPFGGPHLNHLTPRTLDIHQTDKQMQELGIDMLGEIQGPKHSIVVQLWQTSFLAPPVEVTFQLEGGSTEQGTHTAQFGEIEQRGAALTPAGRKALSDKHLADNYEDMAKEGHIFFTLEASEILHQAEQDALPSSLQELIKQGYVVAHPITYEDFLAKSARAIFSSTVQGSQANKDIQNLKDAQQREQELSDIIGTPIIDSDELYAKAQQDSIDHLCKTYGLSIDLHAA